MKSVTKPLKYWDLFCGASLAGTGIEIGFQRLALQAHGLGINHNPRAIETSQINHPEHTFLCTDIHDVRPRTHFPENDAFLGWASPSCVHHSTARGGRPINDQERVSAWEVVKWVHQTNPKLFMIENVPEFEDWGPLMPKVQKKTGKFLFSFTTAKVGGVVRVLSFEEAFKWKGKKKRIETTEVPVPRGNKTFERWVYENSLHGYELCMVKDPSKAGQDFNRLIAKFRALGYEVDWRCIVMADYGDPTTRKRLFVQGAKISEGLRVVWPEPTHAKPDKLGNVPEGLKPWVTFRQIMDASDLGTPLSERKRQLAPKTLNRIIIGLKKFVLGQPFLVPNFGERSGQEPRTHSTDNPLPTVTSHGAGGLASAFIIPQQTNPAPKGVDEPIGALVVEGSGPKLVTGFVIPQQRGGAPVKSLDAPVSPITTKGAEAVAIVKLHGTSSVESLDQPLSTISAGGQHHAVMSTNLVMFYGQSTAASADEPLDTVTSKERFGLVNTFVTAIDQQSSPDATASADSPVSTITTKQRHAVVNACLVNTAHGPSGGENGRVKDLNQPLGTIVAGGQDQALTSFELREAHRVHSVDAPLKTVVGNRGDQAVITFEIPGWEGQKGTLVLNCLSPGGKGRPVLEVGDQKFEIEVYFRMLKVSELAAAHSLPKDYKFAGTKTDAVRQIGNGVPLKTVQALTMAAVSQNSMIVQSLQLAA
jgi:DNA (cytosine-5)-methyltransferase 1